MKLFGYAIVLASLFACIAANSASAEDCPGVFIRDLQSYDNRNNSNSLERIDVVVPKGTRDTIVGYVIVGGKKYYVQMRAYLHDPADIRLKPGCVLEKYE